MHYYSFYRFFFRMDGQDPQPPGRNAGKIILQKQYELFSFHQLFFFLFDPLYILLQKTKNAVSGTPERAQRKGQG